MENRTQDDKPVISIVIPIYGEGPYLSRLIAEIRNEITKLDLSYEIIFVDDGSLDDTWMILEDEAERHPEIKAIGLSRNFGKEAALCAGLERAKGSAVIVMDGDLQHPPSLIPEMIRRWIGLKADVVEGVKMDRGKESSWDRIGAWIFYAILKKLSGYNLEGATDYKLLDRRVVNAWLAMEERGVFFRGMTVWLGFNRVQIPFAVPERVGGRSRWSTFKLIKLALTSISAFTSIPLQFITMIGIGFFFFAVVLGIQTFYHWVTNQAVSGFTTVILLLLIIGSALMTGLGLIGIYLSRIYEEVKQ